MVFLCCVYDPTRALRSAIVLTVLLLFSLPLQAQGRFQLRQTPSGVGVSIGIPITATSKTISQKQFGVDTDYTSGLFAVNLQNLPTPYTRAVFESLGMEKIKAISLQELNETTAKRGTRWSVTSIKYARYGAFDGLLVNAKEIGASSSPLASSHFYSTIHGDGLDLNIFYFQRSVQPGLINAMLKSLQME